MAYTYLQYLFLMNGMYSNIVLNHIITLLNNFVKFAKYGKPMHMHSSRIAFVTLSLRHKANDYTNYRSEVS